MYAAHVLPAAREYGALYRSFRWQIPAFYNIGVDVCDRWAGIDPARTAIFNLRADGTVEEVSYSALRETSNRLANALAARGIAKGDRVAILLPQGPAVAVSHIAIYKLGAIALPLAMLFGLEAISYRLKDSGARTLITNAQGLAKLPAIRDTAPALEFVWSVDGPADGAEDFNAMLARAASEFTPVATAADGENRAALGRLGRRGARRRDLRMGQGDARHHHQRVLRANRMQSRGGLLRSHRYFAARCDGQTGARPQRRRHPARRLTLFARRARSDRDQAAGSGDVLAVLGQARRDAGKIHRRLDDHGRSRCHRR